MSQSTVASTADSIVRTDSYLSATATPTASPAIPTTLSQQSISVTISAPRLPGIQQHFRLPPPSPASTSAPIVEQFSSLQQPAPPVASDRLRQNQALAMVSLQQQLPFSASQSMAAPIFTTRMTSQPQVSPHLSHPQHTVRTTVYSGHQVRCQSSVSSNVAANNAGGQQLTVTTVPQPQGASPLISQALHPPSSHNQPVRQQMLGNIPPQTNQASAFHISNLSASVPRLPPRLPVAATEVTQSATAPAPPKSKAKKSKSKKPPAAPCPSVSSIQSTVSEITASVASSAPVPPCKAKPSRKKPSQSAVKKLSAAALKLQEEELKYKRKYQLLKRSIKALVFKNAALCDEVARLNQRIHTVTEERKVLLKRVFHHERLKQKKIAAAQRKQAAQAKNDQETVPTNQQEIQPEEKKTEPVVN